VNSAFASRRQAQLNSDSRISMDAVTRRNALVARHFSMQNRNNLSVQRGHILLVAPIPNNEPERLAYLKSLSLFDSPPEPRFQRIVEVAADLFDAPIVLISLIAQERQWFLAKRGLEVRETARDVSFCTHGLEQSGLFVADAAADKRFSGNPHVTGAPKIGCYMGATLRSAAGIPIGALCIIANAAGAFAQCNQQHLDGLARWTELELFSRPSTAHRFGITASSTGSVRHWISEDGGAWSVDAALLILHGFLEHSRNQRATGILVFKGGAEIDSAMLAALPIESLILELHGKIKCAIFQEETTGNSVDIFKAIEAKRHGSTSALYAVRTVGSSAITADVLHSLVQQLCDQAYEFDPNCGLHVAKLC